MTKIVGAPTLDDALSALGEEIRAHEARGERTLIFCEDRLTLLAEQAVLEAVGGTFLTEVTTFARFLKGEEKMLSKHGSVMAVARILSEEELCCFRENAARAVYETIAQLLASRVTCEMLENSAGETDGMLSLKLRDLSLVYRKYVGLLSERGLTDENGYLALLPSRIASAGLGDVHVLFFAFQSFTGQAREGVRAAIEHARSVTGIFLAGREAFYTNEAVRVFRAVAESMGETETVRKQCTLDGEGKLLHASLFSPEQAPQSVPAAHITRFSASDEEEEMNTVAALIRKLTHEGRRYRDIAVLVESADDYLVAEKAFTAYNIPYYADRKRSFSEHPFCAFALAALEAAGSGVLPEYADDLAASAYFGEGGEYRNYLLKFGNYRGAVRREIKAETALGGMDRASLVKARERMLSILKLFRAKDACANYCAAVRALWDLVEGERVTQSLREGLSREESDFLEIGRLWEILGETAEISGERVFSAREFADLLANGLQALEVSMLPQYADAVFVGDITESRIRRTPVLFCTGLTDALPRVAQDTAVITDGEIGRLERLKVEIEPAIAVVNLRAREALALNLCAFSEELYLSCPACKGGEETAPSEALLFAAQALEPKKLPDLFPYDCSAYGPALLAYYRACDALSGASAPESAAELIARYSSIREAIMNYGFGHGTGEDPQKARMNARKPSVMEAADLYFGGDISPTLLENYFECPYKSFAMRALHVSEREERGALDAADAGAFVHTVLERTARAFNELETEEACRAYALETADALLKEPQFAGLADTAAGEYTGGRLAGEAASVTAAAFRQLISSKYRVRETEANVKIPQLRLRGKADRIDAAEGAVRVIDYKTGNIDDSPSAYYTGRKLQLQLYLLAASEGGMPAGAFYFPAADDFTGAADEEGKYRMKGFFVNDEKSLNDMDPALEKGKKSAYFEGGGRTEKGMSREDFEDFLAYALYVSQGAEREMRSGNVEPSPYDGACRYCKLKGMCGFVGVPRKEGAVKCKQIAAVARAEKGEGRI